MSDINASELNELADQINQIEEQPSALLGFDGFVDLIIHLVDERRTVDDYIRLDEMTKFADLIHEASGKSANVEMVPVRKKLGGNGPIMGQALLDGGASVSYMGALGKGRVHPVFEEFAERCDYIVSLADPGHTEALEFKDGKLMLGKYESLKDVSWKRLIDKVGQEQLDELHRSSDLIACLNWTMVQYMNGILSGLKPRFDALDQEPLLFIDLADPRKRTIEDQETMLDLVSDFDESATVILGLNEEESRQIAEVLGLEREDEHPARARNIRSELELSRVVVHPVDSASVATPDEVYSVQGPYTESPQLTTGAGDNFNAGYCLGELYGFSPRKCLQMGVHTSGFYVREAESPSPDQIASFMRERAESATTT